MTQVKLLSFTPFEKLNIMEEIKDKLIRINYDFVDIPTGEVIAKGVKRDLLSAFSPKSQSLHDIIASLIRGLKADKNVALSIIIAPSEHQPTELKIQFDFLNPVSLDTVLTATK